MSQGTSAPELSRLPEMEQSWFPPKENAGPPETRVFLANQSEEVNWREDVPQQQRHSRGLEMSCRQMWSCEEGQALINMVRGPLFDLVVNKSSFHRLLHMLLAYIEANEGHKLLSYFFYFPLANSALIMMQSRQYSSTTGSKRTYFLSGMTCRDGLYPEIFAAKCVKNTRIKAKSCHSEW